MIIMPGGKMEKADKAPAGGTGSVGECLVKDAPCGWKK
jgi:hypothetical protein